MSEILAYLALGAFFYCMWKAGKWIAIALLEEGDL